MSWIAAAVLAAGATAWLLQPRSTVCTFPGNRRHDGEHAVASAVMLYRTDHRDFVGCPTLEELWDERYLPRDVATNDARGSALWMECREGRVVIWSAGPDSKRGTNDDFEWMRE